ncbi:MAG: peptidoglycan DD-metalloendopeptidase family protein [Patescibacteria group bacterium]
MKNQKTKKIKQFIGLVLLCSAIFLFNFRDGASATTVSVSTNNDKQVQELQQEMELKKLEIEKIQKKIEVYQKDLENKRREKITLTNELDILSNQINELELQMNQANLQIDATNLEIQSVLLQILDKEDAISKQKAQLAEIIRSIYGNDQRNYLEVLASNNNFSDFFDEVEGMTQLESKLKSSLDEMKAMKADLETKRQDLDKKSIELNTLKEKLETAKSRLDGQETAKTYYLSRAKKSEKEFQNLISQAQAEQAKINGELVSLEKTVRQRLQQSGEELSSTGRFVWPVPKNVITATFHDPDYPFRYIFEHPAIDIKAAQGTPVKAADSGYVGKVKDGGAKGYSYIMLIHDNGLATVYGHVSKIYVSADTYVKQGDIIGLSGGMPGTSGSGSLSTGPHMHFEVRLDGIPVNPLDYLP